MAVTLKRWLLPGRYRPKAIPRRIASISRAHPTTAAGTLTTRNHGSNSRTGRRRSLSRAITSSSSVTSNPSRGMSRAPRRRNANSTRSRIRSTKARHRKAEAGKRKSLCLTANEAHAEPWASFVRCVQVPCPRFRLRCPRIPDGHSHGFDRRDRCGFLQ